MHENDNNPLTALYGLVLCGGSSSRMGMDKGKIIYHEMQQRYHVYEMLLPFCEKVFLSCKEDQARDSDPGYSVITDFPSYNNIGPMAALLTAFQHFPGKDLLIVGCDYPYFTKEELQSLISVCKGKQSAICFYNEKEDLYEPLLGWYPYAVADELINLYGSNQYSLQYFLKKTNAGKFYPENKNCIISVDTKEASDSAGKLFRSDKKYR